MGSLKFSVFSCFLIFAFCSINVTPVEVNNLAKVLLEFARDFYSQSVETKPGNVVIAPVSVANLLALLSQGSSRNTLEELKKALHVSSDKAALADQFLDLRLQIRNNIGQASAPVANQIYLQQGQSLNRKFQEIAAQKYFSGVESLNFAESEKSAQTINQFVEQRTIGKIKNLIKPEQLSAETRSVLVSAVYFKGNWENPFFADFTAKRDFHVSETKTVPVDFMFVKDVFNYKDLEDLKAEALELKFANSSISLVIVLPKDRISLKELETKLKTYDLSKITEKMDSSRFEVYVPKFKVEFEINLINVLKNLGINELSSDGANLRDLLESGESLKVSEIVHKATLEIDERGAEAAAGTGAVVLPISLPPLFNVDHPFTYFIRESQTNTILFSGRIENF